VFLSENNLWQRKGSFKKKGKIGYKKLPKGERGFS
jgi:hypothetical protein